MAFWASIDIFWINRHHPIEAVAIRLPIGRSFLTSLLQPFRQDGGEGGGIDKWRD